QAVYSSTEKLNKMGLGSKNIAKLNKRLFPHLEGKIDEILPTSILKQYNLISREEALRNLHFPQSIEKLQAAQYRLKFEELFLIQLELIKLKLLKTQKSRGFIFDKIGAYFLDFYDNQLPFELTQAQKRVLKEIRKDLGTGNQMNRLLQGDVGSGKTIVALMSILMAMDNGYQSALMAPTEILATQHFDSVKEFLDQMNVKYALLTGSTRTAERRRI